MKKSSGLVILFLSLICVIAPVAACHLEVTTLGEKEVCMICNFYTYTINIKSVAEGSNDVNYLVRIEEILPAGINYVSYTQDGPVPVSAECASPSSAALDTSCRKIRWSYSNVPHNAQWSIMLNVKPIDKGDGDVVINRVKSRLAHDPGDSLGGLVISDATTVFRSNKCALPSPEFPAIAFPATFIGGMLGTVLFIRKTKEN